VVVGLTENIEHGGRYVDKVFSEIELTEGSVHGCEFEECKFVNCNLAGCSFIECKFTDCDFNSCNLNLIKLNRTKFFETHFRESKITGVNWTLLDWRSYTLNSPISFETCDLSLCIFNSLELREMCMHSCKAHDADFSASDLTGSDLYKTDFKESDFSRSKLNKCNFSESINYRIDPLECSIEGARFSSPEVLTLLRPFNIKIDDD
jgi:uncharacterized protein YjbI with pentapeptide repeats